jgi:SH3-like domain-containing protein
LDRDEIRRALHIYCFSFLDARGLSVEVVITAKSWRQIWSKDEAIDLVASRLRSGEWAPLLTMWLGDGEARRMNVLSSEYKLVIAAKEPWRLDSGKSIYEAVVATGREAFERFREAAGAYGVLLDLSKSHKWTVVKLATDDALRLAYKLKWRRGT